jgi:hypothetical protein
MFRQALRDHTARTVAEQGRVYALIRPAAPSTAGWSNGRFKKLMSKAKKEIDNWDSAVPLTFLDIDQFLSEGGLASGQKQDKSGLARVFRFIESAGHSTPSELDVATIVGVLRAVTAACVRAFDKYQRLQYSKSFRVYLSMQNVFRGFLGRSECFDFDNDDDDGDDDDDDDGDGDEGGEAEAGEEGGLNLTAAAGGGGGGGRSGFRSLLTAVAPDDDSVLATVSKPWVPMAWLCLLTLPGVLTPPMRIAQLVWLGE